MDFILGIFTGISIAILWVMYLNKQREKKRGAVQAKFDDLQKRWEKFQAALINLPELAQIEKVIEEQTLIHQLNNAIERDDFEEAARLRDLMNKKD